MYDAGDGVSRNSAEALKWWRRAAEQDDPDGQYSLGVAYKLGIGTDPDPVISLMWFNLAATRATAAQLRDKTIRNRDLVAKHMSPDQVGEAQRLAEEWKPGIAP